MAYTFEFISKRDIDPAISGNTETTEITFRCERFLYFAQCFQNILQFVKSERYQSYMNWPVPPTELEIEEHDQRRRAFNQDHTIIQSWLDSL